MVFFDDFGLPLPTFSTKINLNESPDSNSNSITHINELPEDLQLWIKEQYKIINEKYNKPS